MDNRWTLLEPAPEADPIKPLPVQAKPVLVPLVRSMEQLEAALEHSGGDIYVELEDPKRYPEAVERVRATGAGAFGLGGTATDLQKRRRLDH